MIYLLLAIICSSSLALILKHGNVKKSNTAILINANYLTASVLSLVFVFYKGSLTISLQAFLFALFLGYLFAATFFIYSKAVGLAGTALATVSARLSVLIPVLFSIILYGESPNIKMIFGFGMALVTLYLFYLSLKNHDGKPHSKGSYLILILLLFGIGLVDFSMKIFERNFPSEEKGTFVFTIFFSAFVYTLGYILFKKIKFQSHTFKLGLLLGLPNVLAIHFVLAALSELEAIVVFPIQNIGVIVFTAIMAYIIWKEKINNYGIAALIAGIISIILLRI
ncbi:MAG: EamA family transporter [Ignavibacterium sp.]|jgi:drug/metabolite transporter (DMT)-like permease|uniref:EamA family transporter n=1 Tax=Ignavibacterium sp. TaxID=2651167 RepID=UPI0032985F2B